MLPLPVPAGTLTFHPCWLRVFQHPSSGFLNLPIPWHTLPSLDSFPWPPFSGHGPNSEWKLLEPSQSNTGIKYNRERWRMSRFRSERKAELEFGHVGLEVLPEQPSGGSKRGSRALGSGVGCWTQMAMEGKPWDDVRDSPRTCSEEEE